jgi:GntR family transcriptional regulator
MCRMVTLPSFGPSSRTIILIDDHISAFDTSQPSVYAVYMTKHSWVVISQADSRPLYLQVIEQVRRRVAAGDLTPGAELPSIRQLAADAKVSVITIKRAYLELERDGVIVTRQGKGSFVADYPTLQATVQEQELEIHLARAAEQALLLGVSKTELQKRLNAAIEHARGVAK